MKPKTALLAAIATIGFATQATAAPLTLAEQGSFAIGGTVKTSPGSYTPIPESIAKRSGGAFWDAHKAAVAAGGMTLHGDHASVFYQIPVDAKKTGVMDKTGAKKRRSPYAVRLSGVESL